MKCLELHQTFYDIAKGIPNSSQSVTPARVWVTLIRHRLSDGKISKRNLVNYAFGELKLKVIGPYEDQYGLNGHLTFYLNSPLEVKLPPENTKYNDLFPIQTATEIDLTIRPYGYTMIKFFVNGQPAPDDLPVEFEIGCNPGGILTGFHQNSWYSISLRTSI